MILAIAMALVTQTYGGQMNISQNLDAHSCAEMQSVALTGESLEQKASDDAKALAAEKAEQAKNDAVQASWDSANPAKAARCAKLNLLNRYGAQCGPRFQWSVMSGYLVPGISPSDGDIKRAECVQ